MGIRSGRDRCNTNVRVHKRSKWNESQRCTTIRACTKIRWFAQNPYCAHNGAAIMRTSQRNAGLLLSTPRSVIYGSGLRPSASVLQNTCYLAGWLLNRSPAQVISTRLAPKFYLHQKSPAFAVLLECRRNPRAAGFPPSTIAPFWAGVWLQLSPGRPLFRCYTRYLAGRC